jgi:hypothetical protein
MAKNTGKDYRQGSVTDRSQFERKDGHWQKRDADNGQFGSVKSTDNPYKGVAKEPDGRKR